MLLADDPPLLESKQPAGFETLSLEEPMADNTHQGVVVNGGAAVAASEPGDVGAADSPAAGERSIAVTFEQAGSLGIEFERLSAPYVVQEIRAGGLAHGRGLDPFDWLVAVGGESAEGLQWDEVMRRLAERPVTATFLRCPKFAVTFEQNGSLGIEFERQSAPYVVEEVHARGLAHGRGLEPGDRLVAVGSEPTGGLQWDELVRRLTLRPVTATFVRCPKAPAESGSGALLSGLTSRMMFLGGSVAQQGLDLGSKVGSVGLDLGSKVGTAGLDLGTKVGSAGLGFGSKVGGAGLGLGSKVGSMTSSLYSGLLETVQDTFVASDAPAVPSPSNGALDSTAEQSGPVNNSEGGQRGEVSGSPAENEATNTASWPDADFDNLLAGCSNAAVGPGSEGASTALAPVASPCSDALDSAGQNGLIGASGGEQRGDVLGSATDSGGHQVGSWPKARAPVVTQPGLAAAQLAGDATPEVCIPSVTGVAPVQDRSTDDGGASDERAVTGGSESLPACPTGSADSPCSPGASAGGGGVGPSGGGLGGVGASPPAGPGSTAAEEPGGGREDAARGDAVGKALEDVLGVNGKDGTGGGSGAVAAEASALGRGGTASRILSASFAPLESCSRPPAEDAVQTSREVLANGSDAILATAPTSATTEGASAPNNEGSPGSSLAPACIGRSPDSGQEAQHSAPETRSTAGPDSVEVERLRAEAGALGARLREAEAATSSAQATGERLGAELRDRDARVSRLEVELAAAREGCEARLAELRAAAEASAAEVGRREQAAAERCEALAQARQQELEAELTQAHAELEAREHQSAAARAGDAEALRAAQAALSEARAAQEREAVAAKGQLEQLRFALSERERQLADRGEVLSRKEEEVKSLLRQLAALDGPRELQEAAADEAPEEAATRFDVMFALEGALGLEFQRQAAPYVVGQVHSNGVATGLGILPGDELVMVAEESVIEATWEELVQRLSRRPVVAGFRRDPSRQQKADGSFISSVSSVGTSLLSKARSAVPVVPGLAPGQGSEPQDARWQAEAERLGTLLRARDAEVEELSNRLKQREEALRLLEAGSAGAAEAARLAQEREALAQQLQDTQARAGRAEQQAEELRGECERLRELCQEEARQKEEQRQQANALAERCTSLMAQFESLRATCQSLSLDSQQKSTLEGQVQELMMMNAQWQQAHQNLTSESEELRQRAVELQQLQSEVMQLRRFQEACVHLEQQLREADERLEEANARATQVQDERQSEQATIHRLQALIESMEENGESQAGQLEAELLAQRRECAALQRESDEQRKMIEELRTHQRESREAAEEGRALKADNEDLKRDLAASRQEQQTLNNVVEQCIAKLEKESQERPHLVDKRMVTQMLAAYLEQRDNPRQQQEIMTKMADLLGFTTAEREQVGLAQRRRGLLDQDDSVGLADLTDRFVDFLFEESEGA